MGAVQTCSSTPTTGAVSLESGDKAKAYQWYGIHVLTAKCKKDDKIYFDKEINIFMIITLAMVALLIMYLVIKMMHRNSAGGMGMPMQM